MVAIVKKNAYRCIWALRWRVGRLAGRRAVPAGRHLGRAAAAAALSGRVVVAVVVTADVISDFIYG